MKPGSGVIVLKRIITMENRVIELETRLSFQEDTIHELNEVVTRQQNQIDVLQEQVGELKKRVQSVSTSNIKDEGEETPPPHY